MMDCLTMESGPFRHEQIDTKGRQIRLVTILPAPGGAIQSRIKTFDLEGTVTPDYRALSYTWGPPNPIIPIELNQKRFFVRKNLYNFLRHFKRRLEKFSGHGRFEEEEQWLWIDQICIDQAATKERNHQVEMMSEIYRRASYVYLWLGASSFVTKTVVRAIKNNYHLYHHRENQAHINADVRSSIDDAIFSPCPDNHVETFFQNPYWTRLWIVQEVMLARYIRIFIEDTIVSWEELKRFCTIRSDGPKRLRWLVENAQTGQTFSFSVLFDIFGENRCADPSDRVYAFLGIVHPDERVQVDYAKPSYYKFVQAVFLILPKERQSHSGLFKAVQEHDYRNSQSQTFMNVATAMMCEARQETGLRLMDAICTLASQLHIDLKDKYGKVSEDSKDATKAIEEELRNHWTDLAQAYTALYVPDAGYDREKAWNMRSMSCDLLEGSYKRGVELTTTFFDALADNFLKSYPGLINNMDSGVEPVIIC